MTSALQSIPFEAPVLNPAANGLYNATTWFETDAGAPSRFLGAGVQIRPHNFGGEDAFGVWGAGWCAQLDDLTEDDVKDGERPTGLDPFEPMVVWAYDQCDLTLPSQREVRERAAQNMRLLEQNAVEHEFAERLLTDIADQGISPLPTIPIVGLGPVPSITLSVAHIETEFAKTNTIGLIHAAPKHAAFAVQAGVAIRSGTKYVSPLGHQWVFGGGYVDVLGNGTIDLVGTSPTFGWRDDVQVRDTIKQETNQ